MKSTRFLAPALALLTTFSLSQTSFAASATWSADPTSADWNTAANWMPNTVPNGPADTATFDVSSTTAVSLSAPSTEVASIIFNAGASPFNIITTSLSSSDISLIVSGAGITNDSSVPQRLSVGSGFIGHTASLHFQNSASAGSGTILTAYGASNIGTNGATVQFEDASTAGDASCFALGALAGHESGGGAFVFNDNSNAGHARFRVKGGLVKGGTGGGVSFRGSSSAAHGVFKIFPADDRFRDSGGVGFTDLATAGDGKFIFYGSSAKYGYPATATFSYGATAGRGLFQLNGAKAPGTYGTDAYFSGYDFTGLITTGGEATFIMNGGQGAGAEGGHIGFSNFSTAGQARLIAHGGEDGGGGGFISLDAECDGGEAEVEVYGNGYLLAASVTIGSLAGNGFVYLGDNTLAVGSNDFDTFFLGSIQEEGGGANGSHASLRKIGSGRLTLGGASPYAGGTTVDEGILEVENTTGSATGTGMVLVGGGTFGGGGMVAGAVTIGDGGGALASLAPSIASENATTLTLQASLTFVSDGIYHVELKADGNADRVVANGVTIGSGAKFELANSSPALPPGSVLTLIDNTSASAIAGAFANLPEGAIITSGANNFQASYSGGDGNDFTLTVVP